MNINAGSGQRKFGEGWINVDINPKWEPDVCCPMEKMPFPDSSADLIVSHHTIEHLGCDGADDFIDESRRILKPGGSLLIFVPDLRKLAEGWLFGRIDDFTYTVNLYGAYMGDEYDRHKWGYSYSSLHTYLSRRPWTAIKPFNWRHIPGALIANDWWILGMECIK